MPDTTRPSAAPARRPLFTPLRGCPGPRSLGSEAPSREQRFRTQQQARQSPARSGCAGRAPAAPPRWRPSPAQPGPAQPGPARPPRRALAAPHARYSPPRPLRRAAGGDPRTPPRGWVEAAPAGEPGAAWGRAERSRQRGGATPAGRALRPFSAQPVPRGHQRAPGCPAQRWHQPGRGGGVAPRMFSGIDNPFALPCALVWKGETQPPSSIFTISQSGPGALAVPSLPHPSRFWKSATEAAAEAAKPAPKASARLGWPGPSPGHPRPLPQPRCLLPASHTLSVCASLRPLSDVSPFPC